MGIYDRDYYRTPTRGGFAEFRMWSVNTWLIAINVAVFVLDIALYRLSLPSDPAERWEAMQSAGGQSGPLFALGYFSLTTAIHHLQIWRFITFQFLHASIGHIFFNMLGLYFFGPIVEGQLGSRRYLGFYLLCGCAGAVSFLILGATQFILVGPNDTLIGASAGIFGVLVAAAMIAPDMQITLLFPPIPVRLRVLAWVYLGIAVYTIFSMGGNAGGEAAHLGGALLGFLLIRNQQWLNFLSPRTRYVGAVKRKRVAFRDWSRDMDH